MINKGSDPALEPALRDVDSIQNLDTARLALRWALERMRALENRVAQVETAAKLAEESRGRAVSELDGARELLSRRAGESAERERYYAKIEEYLNLKLEGGLDAASLAARETRIDAREAELQSREIATESKIKESRIRMEEETRQAVAEAAAAAELKVRAARGDSEKRAAALERDLTERMLSLHEKDAQLSALERSLEERRRRFEEFFAASRASLQSDSAAINQAAADQADFLERRVSAALAAKTAALERGWQADKQILMEELAAWRGKAREHLPEMLEARRRAEALEAANARLADEKRLLEQTQAVLTDELRRWRKEAQDDVPALLATARRAVDAEDKAARLESELDLARRRAEESLAELMAAELGEEKRREELLGLETALTLKLRDAETDLFRQYDAWREREAALRRRDQDWRLEAEARRESLSILRGEVTAQRDELKKVIAAYREKTESYRADSDPKRGEAE
ncbi:MAG: hypothetical protein ACHQ49_16295 [Elusimicrobiota bacterium]